MTQLAGRGKRFMAAVIDAALGCAVAAVPHVGLLVALAYGLTKDAWPILDGQSIGKKAMGIRAVRAATGEPITRDYLTALLRQVSLFIPFFNVVDALMVFSAERRRFGDRWAGTVVVDDARA